MRKLAHYIHNHLSCCLNCGSLWVAGYELCPPCLAKLQSKEKLLTFYSEDLKVHALHSWVPAESDLLSHWLVSLKGGRKRETWKWLAYRMLANKLGELPNHCVVVPAPPSKVGKRDHAYEWGKALADSIGADFAPVLFKEGKSQRQASGADRQDVSLRLIENYSGLERVRTGSLWIFADDILTTGSTARAARKALGNPPHFETWVVAHRKLSCGASKHLL